MRNIDHHGANAKMLACDEPSEADTVSGIQPLSNPREAAIDYTQVRGWSVVPVEYRGKKPSVAGWQDLGLTTDSVLHYFNDKPQNIGILMGSASGGLTDCDLDCKEAVRLASRFLPKTQAVFGRASKPASHWLYVTNLASTHPKATISFKDPIDGTTILELRIGGGGHGAQTVVPGSVHESGERITWDSEGDPEPVEGAELLRRASELAAAALLTRHWGNPGDRNDDRMALTGMLLRQGGSEEDAARFVGAVTIAAGGEDEPQQRLSEARCARARLDKGEPVYGFTNLAERLGEKVVRKAADWLGLELPLDTTIGNSSRSNRAGEEGDNAAVIQRLAALPRFEYDRVRVEEAERLGVRVSTLDEAVHEARGVAENAAEPRTALADPEPWLEPVDGAALLDEIVATIRRHVVLPDGAAEATALWILHAHAHDAARVSPILAITSPTPECGKTTLLTLLGALTPRPLPASNITAAALFRAVEKWRPTLLIDEADTFLRDNDELRGVLNSGHNRAGAYVIRTVGDDHEPRQFKTWSAKAIARIGNLTPTLSSRSIHIELQRMGAGETVEELRGDRLEHLAPLQRKAWRWAQDHMDELRAADPEMPSGITGRAADNWRPLFAIADAAGGDWPNRIRTVALNMTSQQRDETRAIMLLEDIREIFAPQGTDTISSVGLVAALNELEERPWRESNRGKEMTQNGLARMLRSFKIESKAVRIGGKTPRGYERSQFAEAFRRYPPPAKCNTATSEQDQ